ncbi:sugar ABC transporter permease [Streptomyces europaeiscabiei]|uniref:carbohydrate ABC transporter permease n=1 Tax=Streptomyces europaeiscabiei TaxID=146819 RepID=UPI0029BBDA6C|nr:sugar ABC transporter permease [Streptomyces europaeiscabiei]MDX2773321.1 sugar ABC transporter permease [Streptomyces europaeiscabiei]MDX3711441.1 sugar ABC transporter permease [Streptomyces europaeiscabiei]
MSEPNPRPAQGPGSGPAPARTAAAAKAGGGRGRRTRAPRGGIRGREGLAGWLFVSPVIVVLGLFLVVPIVMALWVSLSDWNGQGSPFSSGVHFDGAENYEQILTEPGLAQSDFMTSLRNNAYYVLFVVPLQTALALGLALLVNGKRLKGKGFFRTAYYFPSVTSSVAISVVFLFIFSSSGVVNSLLAKIGVDGPAWFADPRGIIHLALGALGVNTDTPPSALADTSVGGLSLWEWLAGPSVAMTAIITLVVWTTAGTFMLMFLAALQDIPLEVEEAAEIDGTGRWQRFRHVTLPMLKPTLFLVLTLGLIGTWQVFDQIYVMSKGAPAKTTLTPAFLSYQSSFTDNEWGQGSAIAFILFAIIVAMTLLQRFVLRDKDEARAKAATRRAAKAARSGSGPTAGTI